MCEKKNFVLLVHFRDPFTHMGGSESVVRSHCKILKERGNDVYVLFPVCKGMKFYGKVFSIHAWALLYFDKLVSVVDAYKMQRIVFNLNAEKNCRGVFIHSLIFSDFMELNAILSFRRTIVMYLHDYSTCCSQYTLMKNDLFFCGNALLFDAKCNDCVFYGSGKILKQKMGKFLNQFENLHIISPSRNIADNWMKAYPEYADKVQIIGHKKCLGKYAQNRDILNENEKIRIGFVGKTVKEKGFDLWIKAVDIISKKTDKYEFVYFGSRPVDNPNVRSVSVSIVSDGLDAMTKALRRERVHIAFLFSIIPETYSLTYFECFSSNCFIITSSHSGNIAAEVLQNHNGIVLNPTVEAIVSCLEEINALRDAVNLLRTNDCVGPNLLVDNEDFLRLLSFEENRDEKKILILKKNTLVALITNILYRLRYKQF